jgi:hypothetical protein
MTLDTARDLSLQVAAIPMTFFGMLMNSPDSEFQRNSPQKTRLPELTKHLLPIFGYSESCSSEELNPSIEFRRRLEKRAKDPPRGLKRGAVDEVAGEAIATLL